MFQLLKEPNFDFMRRSNLLLTFSGILVLICIGIIAVVGIDRGIEFTGGTELQIKFTETPDVGAIRDALGAAGLDNQSVTTIGDKDENEIWIRMAGEGAPSDEAEESVNMGEDAASKLPGQVREVLRERFYPGIAEKIDLNIADQATLSGLVARAAGMGPIEAEELATAISDRRTEVALFHSWEEVAAVPGLSAETLQILEGATVLGPLTMRGQSYIGPAVGRELYRKALGAIIGSLLGMLAYIWIRFQLQWGFAAVAALAHDTLITLGLFVIFRQELSLPVVAAFLTLIGYSVNDTVVVFDRIRENLKSQRADSFAALVNLSINQTLSRTIITSGLTFVVVLFLLLFGGTALQPFAFVLTVMVIIGTYSSIYVAAPILVLWRQFKQRREAGSASASTPTARKAKKVRRSSAS